MALLSVCVAAYKYASCNWDYVVCSEVCSAKISLGACRIAQCLSGPSSILTSSTHPRTGHISMPSTYPQHTRCAPESVAAAMLLAAHGKTSRFRVAQMSLCRTGMCACRVTLFHKDAAAISPNRSVPAEGAGPSCRGKPRSPLQTRSGWCMSQAAALTQGSSVALQQVRQLTK